MFLLVFPLANELEVEQILLPHSCNISSLQEWVCNNNSTCNINGLCLNTERVLLNTHIHIYRQANTHLLRDFISSAFCWADAGACQAISRLRWFSLSPLWRESSWVYPSLWDSDICVWTGASQIYSRGSRVQMCVCVFCVVRQWAPFAAPIMFPERRKGSTT